MKLKESGKEKESPEQTELGSESFVEKFQELINFGFISFLYCHEALVRIECSEATTTTASACYTFSN